MMGHNHKRLVLPLVPLMLLPTVGERPRLAQVRWRVLVVRRAIPLSVHLMIPGIGARGMLPYLDSGGWNLLAGMLFGPRRRWTC